MSLLQLWSQAVANVNWHACMVNSHAAALFVVYLFWYFNFHLPCVSAKNAVLKQRSIQKSHSSKQKAQVKKGNVNWLNALPDPIPSTSSESDEEEDKDIALEKACPDATAMERQRFLTARGGSLSGAKRSLAHYVQWVHKLEETARQYSIQRATTGNRDVDIWNEACAIALKARHEPLETTLPQVIRTHRIEGSDVTDLQGYRIFHIIPAQMDDKLATTSTYSLATAVYINLHLDREEGERVTVCMDVRAGRGWPNIHALRLIPFMQQTTTLLLRLFPERLHRCILYPVPSSFLWVWGMVSKVIDPLTKDKICLLSGPNKIVAPPPFDQMYEYMEESVAKLLEDSRIAAFK